MRACVRACVHTHMFVRYARSSLVCIGIKLRRTLRSTVQLTRGTPASAPQTQGRRRQKGGGGSAGGSYDDGGSAPEPEGPGPRANARVMAFTVEPAEEGGVPAARGDGGAERGRGGGGGAGASGGGEDPPVLAFLRRHGLESAFVRIEDGGGRRGLPCPAHRFRRVSFPPRCVACPSMHPAKVVFDSHPAPLPKPLRPRRPRRRRRAGHAGAAHGEEHGRDRRICPLDSGDTRGPAH